ncbi:MAG: rod shape-determining protein MreC [Candidatus Hydrogenedens sp.]|jgi:rod shape-determining protein MreC|nr:rod shape-determining protein MreC [Candidatus Hydrogenedens sp.]
MNPGRFLAEYRPKIILTVIVLLSLFSLITDTDSSFIHVGLSRFVSISAYPFLKLRYMSVRGAEQAYKVVADPNSLRKENEELQLELASLRKQNTRMRQLDRENQRLRRMLGFVQSEPQLSLHPAAVLESYKGMLRIEGGSMQDFQVSMGVITADGVVGIITEVADFTSIVATLHHVDCRVGAMVLRNRLRAYDGVIHASGSDFSHLCSMEYIDMKEEVRIGDHVVSSPESLFPAGLPIGKITGIRGGGGLWKSASIEPVVNPYQLDEVLIIMRALEAPEFVAGPPTSFRGSAVPVVSKAPEMPDQRSLQERYAP